MKKRRFLILGCIVVGVLLFVTFCVPYFILLVDKQEKVAEEYAYSESFLNEYDEVRMHLTESVDALRAQGKHVEVYAHPVDEADGLYIDTIYVPGEKEQKDLIVFTTGVHGIEGYIGSVMLDVFWKEIYPELNSETTGVLVIANVNPYGMKYHRRYNENNVDLNRNFITDWDTFDLSVNKEYPKVENLLGPQKAMGNIFWHGVGFYASMIKSVITDGADTISDALLGGQYEYEQGVYYGGAGDEISTSYVKDVFQKTLESAYENIIHIDIHSGYGQRYKMVIFNSAYETLNEVESVQAFGYDNVIAYDSEAFYPTTGDTTDFYYRLWEKNDSEKSLFSTCFEFGTIGDSFWDTVLSMKYTVEENQNYWYPSENKITDKVIDERYHELFYPTEKEWREKTITDFTEACNGVLKAKLLVK